MWRQVPALLARLRMFFRRGSRFAAEQDEEFSFHLEMAAAENVRRGMNPAEARRAAMLSFGGAQRFREEAYDARDVAVLNNLARDTRFALRRLHRSPGFTTGVVATLGIGIGAVVGIGTIVYGVLLRDLPYPEPDQLMRVGFVTEGIASTGDLHSAATFFHFATAAKSFTELGGYYSPGDDFNVTDGDAPEPVTVAFMTPAAFRMLGVRPMLGQLFAPGDTSWTSGRIPILMSENFWRRRYGSDPSIIGRRIDINRGERIVIGILPRSFAFPTESVDLFYPAVVPVGQPPLTARYLHVIGRLRDGVTPEAATAELDALIPALPARFGNISSDLLQQSRARVVVQPLKAATVAAVRPQLVLLGALVAIVLVVATTNVLNLFLLRTERASREIAIALSLGATRLALAQRFVIEGIVFGMASALIGLPVAALVLSTKFGFTEREIPRLHETSFGAETVVLVVGCAVVIGAAVGLIGLTRTGMAGIFDHLRASRSSMTQGWRRAQDGLAAFQIALALTLLVAAGLLGRSFWNLRNAEIGFQPNEAAMFQISLPWGPDGYTSYAKGAVFHARVLERLATLPGVASVDAALRLPLASQGAPVLAMQLRATDTDEQPIVAAAGNMASPEYFHTIGIPLRAGRSFEPGDLRGTPAVVISERLAHQLFGTAPALGRRITWTARPGDKPMPFTIVGVVGDVHWWRIEDGLVPMVYFPLLRDNDGLPSDSSAVPYRPTDVMYVIRGTHLPSRSVLQEIVMELDRRVPVANVQMLGTLLDDATATVRLTMLLIATASGAALLLGLIGVYSVVAYAANGRLQEFGIRLALGATPRRVGRLVLGDGVRIVAIGTIVGLAAALGTTGFLRALLYEVEPRSVTEFGSATVLLLVVTLCAAMFPAWRASRTHPAVVLREN